MAQQEIFRIVLEEVGVTQAQERIKQNTREINKEIKKVSEGTAEYAKFRNQLAENALKTRELKERQRELNKEFKEARNSVPKDSLAGLRLEYAKLTEQISKLTAAERSSDLGQSIIRKASGLKGQINSIEESVGRFTGSVGNYKKGALAIGDIITGGLATGGIVAAVQAVTQVMSVGFAQARAYEQALDDLSALTGLTGEALASIEAAADGLREIAIGGEQVIQTGPEILNAMKLVGGAQPELLKSADALAAVTREAIILSRASGDDLESSVRALTTVLGQFKEPASEAGRIINELAAGAKEGASEIPDTTEALQKFGTTAANANISTAESIALIETLADRQLKGAEAGTQLRNVLTKLASADVLPRQAQEQMARLGIDVNILKDATIPLEVRLRELGKAQGDVAALSKIFGLENLQAAQILTEGVPKYIKLNEAISGTNEAYKQAEIRAGNQNTAMENLKNKGLNLLESGFRALEKPISLVIGALDLLFDAVNIVLNPIDSLIDGLDFVAEKFGLISPPTDKLVSLETGLNALIGPINDVAKGNSVMALTAEQAAAQLKKQSEIAKLLGEDVKEPTKTIGGLTREIKDLRNKLLTVEEGSAAWEELSGQLKTASDELRRMKSEAGFTKPMREEAKEAATGIAGLRNEIGRLRKELEVIGEGGNGDTTALTAKMQELADKERELRRLERVLESIRAKVENVGGATPLLPTFDSNALGGNILDAVAGIGTEAQANREKEMKKSLERLQEIAKRGIAKGLNSYEEGKEAEAEIEQKKREEVRDAALDVAAGAADAVFSLAAQRNERQKEDAIAKTEEEYARRIEAAQGNAVLIEQLEREKTAKIEAIEKEAAKKRRQQAIFESIVFTALAVTRALATSNFIGAIAAGALGAAQTAVIAAQPLAKGGAVGDDMQTYPANFFQSLPDYSRGGHTGRGTNHIDGTGQRVAGRIGGRAALHGNEWVSPSWMTRHPVYGAAIATLEKVRARGYAGGGFMPADFIPNFNLPATAQAAQAAANGAAGATVAGFTQEQMEAFARTVANETARATADEVQKGLAIGLNDANRRQEREGYLETARQV